MNKPLRQVLQKPELAGKLTKWAMDPSEFDIQFKPMTFVKGQVVADFIAKHSNPKVMNLSTKGIYQWEMYIDGSSNRYGNGAGIVIKTPDGSLTQTALRFDFKATNNVAEYEALATGLKIILNMGAEHVTVYSNSQVVVNQVNQDYQAKDPEMIRYLKQVKALMAKFIRYEFIQILRDHNSQADTLAKLASTTNMKLPRTVTVFHLSESSIAKDHEIGVLIPEPDGESWMTPIMNYLCDGTFLLERNTTQRIRR